MSNQPIGIEIKKYYYEVKNNHKLSLYKPSTFNEYVELIHELSNKKYDKKVIKRYLDYLYNRKLL